MMNRQDYRRLTQIWRPSWRRKLAAADKQLALHQAQADMNHRLMEPVTRVLLYRERQWPSP
jgi:hypothetical protein